MSARSFRSVFMSQRGEHWVSNALAVLAAVEALGLDVAVAGLALADLSGLKGRGERHRIGIDGGEVLLIDESYNANPASMGLLLAFTRRNPYLTRSPYVVKWSGEPVTE